MHTVYFEYASVSDSVFGPSYPTRLRMRSGFAGLSGDLSICGSAGVSDLRLTMADWGWDILRVIDKLLWALLLCGI